MRRRLSTAWCLTILALNSMLSWAILLGIAWIVIKLVIGLF